MKDLQLFLLLNFVSSLTFTTGFFIGEPNFATSYPPRTQNQPISSPKNIHSIMPTHHRLNATTTTMDRSSKTSLAFVPNTHIHHSQQLSQPSRRPSFQIYCDLDGVLVDFESGVRSLTGKPTAHITKPTMWKHVVRANAFFENLSWTQDGPALWNAIKHLQPNILTGCPSHASSRTEKFHWCQQQLGLDRLHHVDMASRFRSHKPVNGNCRQEGVTNVITCWSENKFRECNTVGSVLIDDREDLRHSWERAGGLFVHHTNADNTIRQLQAHGIL